MLKKKMMKMKLSYYQVCLRLFAAMTMKTMLTIKTMMMMMMMVMMMLMMMTRTLVIIRL